MYGSTSYGSTAYGATISEVPICPISLKYEGDAIILKVTPKNGIAPYYVAFKKNGNIIDPSRLENLPNPIIDAPENVQIIRVYTLDNEDIRTSAGSIDFSVYIKDSCPTGPQICTKSCIINIGCRIPVCNFIVT